MAFGEWAWIWVWFTLQYELPRGRLNPLLASPKREGALRIIVGSCGWFPRPVEAAMNTSIIGLLVIQQIRADQCWDLPSR